MRSKCASFGREKTFYVCSGTVALGKNKKAPPQFISNVCTDLRPEILSV